MASMHSEGFSLQEASARTQEAVRAIQDEIRPNGILELHGRVDISDAAAAATTAAVCLVTGVDPIIDTAETGLPPRTWQDVKPALVKPGHFINGMSRFLFAAEGGRIPPENVDAARLLLGEVDLHSLRDDAAAKNLHKWAGLCCDYFDLVQATQQAEQPDTSHFATHPRVMSAFTSQQPSTKSLDESKGIGHLSGTLAAGGGFIHIRIRAAHNLINMDSGIFGDVSDPLVVVRLGTEEFSTPVIKNSLNPVWDTSNEFVLNAKSEDDTLHVEVQNSNTFLRNQVLGTLDIKFRDLGPPGHWHMRHEKLVDGKGGEIDFDIRFDLDRSTTVTPSITAPPSAEVSRSLDAVPAAAAAAAATHDVPSSHSQRPAAHQSTHDHALGLDVRHPVPSPAAAVPHSIHTQADAEHTLTHGAGTLQLRVLAASSLHSSGRDIVDPYVKVRVAHQEYKTPTISNNPNPEWESGNEFVFGVEKADSMLDLEVLDAGRLVDSSLGSIGMDFRMLRQGHWHRQSMDLQLSKGGTIHFELRFDASLDFSGISAAQSRSHVSHVDPVHHKEPVAHHSGTDHQVAPAHPTTPAAVLAHPEPGKASAAGLLKVVVKSAHNLMNKDTGLFGDVSDPFVEVRLGGQGKKTPTIKNSLSPQWTSDNEFHFELRQGDPTLVELEVLNKNILKNQSLGIVSVDFQVLMSRPGIWARHAEPLLHGQGAEIEYDLHWEFSHPSRDLHVSAPMAHDSLGAVHVPSAKPAPEHRPTETSAGHHTVPYASAAGHVSAHTASHTAAHADVLAHDSRQHQLQQQVPAATAPLATAAVSGGAGHAKAAQHHGSVVQVHLRVLAAHQLPNKDTGMFGDISDPFVKVKVGGQEHKTPTIKNSLDPSWTHDNEFVFNLDSLDEVVELEVFDSGTLRDRRLGMTTLDLRAAHPGRQRWDRRLGKLEGCSGDLEFEYRIDTPVGFTASGPSASAGRLSAGSRQSAGGRSSVGDRSSPSTMTSSARSSAAGYPRHTPFQASRQSGRVGGGPQATRSAVTTRRSPPPAGGGGGGVRVSAATTTSAGSSITPPSGAPHVRRRQEMLARPTPTGNTLRPGQMSVQDMRLKLAQIKREASEMKAMEAQIKWNMKREEEKMRKAEREDKAKEIAAWRTQQAELAKTHDKELEKQRLAQDLVESREFQEGKRVVRQQEKEEEVRLIKEAYVEQKENSRWRVEQAKAIAAEQHKLAVEEHLENMQLVAEYKLDEQLRDRQDEVDTRAARERAELDLLLQKAAAERARELENLEYLREKKNVEIPRRLDGSLHNFP